MYAIHTTPGFIIDSRAYGEADKLLIIFTRDFGLVTVTALGIRHEKSKLRYFCQDHMFGTFSLVRGKEFWRLTSASDAGAPAALQDSSTERMMARIAQLLRRLLHGEESSTELYDVLVQTAEFAAGSSGEEAIKSIESITVLRIMHALGYVGSDPVIDPYLTYTELTQELVSAAALHRTAINQHINKALKESHL